MPPADALEGGAPSQQLRGLHDVRQDEHGRKGRVAPSRETPRRAQRGWQIPQVQRQQHAQARTRVYELRTYTAVEGRLDALHARFKDHLLGSSGSTA